MVTYHRWFLLPMEQYEETDDQGNIIRTYKAPKLVSQDDRLDGFSSGGPFNRTQIENAGYSHLLAYNDATEWRVSVAWGEMDTAWNALNEIHANYHDTETLADHRQDVEPVMQKQFPDWTGWDLAPPEGSNNTA